ncbi:MAG TPA: hypothetical protein VKX16_11950 [Chloroflexota bacterium]|nr:hypothetical protein [Chloroflexota bacterium]
MKNDDKSCWTPRFIEALQHRGCRIDEQVIIEAVKAADILPWEMVLYEACAHDTTQEIPGKNDDDVVASLGEPA